jgi:geranylgeranyl reductase family protein
MYDAIIIGGGPGGLHAGRLLAEQGFEVAVFEEHRRPGEPVHCTGVLALEAFEEFDLGRDSILNPLMTARFFGPAGTSFAYTTKKTEAVVVDRISLDRGLWNRAAASGVALRCDVRVSDVLPLPTGVSVTTSQGQAFNARACVLACGANYSLHRRLGLGKAAGHLQSAQLELPARRPGDTEIHFGSSVAPKGFAWAVPVERPGGLFARIGLMSVRDARGYFSKFLESIRKRWHIETEDLALEPRSKLLPLGPIARTYGDRLLAVGDAAGLVKATTGGGIYYSLLSGRLAAEVLSDGLRRDDLGLASLSVYETRWRALLGRELEAQMTLREIAARLSDEEISSLFELAQTNGIMPILRRTAAFNRHRDVISAVLTYPPARRILLRHALGWNTASLSNP